VGGSLCVLAREREKRERERERESNSLCVEYKSLCNKLSACGAVCHVPYSFDVDTRACKSKKTGKA
jgi:hypothetical protein